jgi:hypothetical protein
VKNSRWLPFFLCMAMVACTTVTVQASSTDDATMTGGGDRECQDASQGTTVEPRNDLTSRMKVYTIIDGRNTQVAGDLFRGPALPVPEGRELYVEQIVDSKCSDTSKWLRESGKPKKVYSRVWYQILMFDRKTVRVPWARTPIWSSKPDFLKKGVSLSNSVVFTVPDLDESSGDVLVIGSCVDLTDSVLEEDEELDAQGKLPKNPDECGTNNSSRKEYLTILKRPEVIDYAVQNAGLINAPEYLTVGESYRLWYEVTNLGHTVSTGHPFTVSISITSPEGVKTLLLKRYVESENLATNGVYLDQPTVFFSAPAVPGIYRFEFCVIAKENGLDADARNNCFYHQKRVQAYEVDLAISPPGVGFEESAYSRYPYPDAAILEGKPYRVLYSVSNFGRDSSVYPFTVSMSIISPEGVKTLLLNRHVGSVRLGFFESTEWSKESFTAPTVPGKYGFEVCVTLNAEEGGVVDVDPNNNCQRVHLIVLKSTVDLSLHFEIERHDLLEPLGLGKPFSVPILVSNYGTIPSIYPFTVSVIITSPEGVKTMLHMRRFEDAILKSPYFPDRGGEPYYYAGLDLVAPTIPGKYGFELCINLEGGVVDTNPDNNCSDFQREVQAK